MAAQPASLTPLSSDTLPQQCIVMDTAIEYLPEDEGLPGEYKAANVSGIRWRYEDGKPSRQAEEACLLPHNFWDWVAKQCRRGTVTWLFACDLLRQLRCNGLLDLLEKGKWEITSIGSDAWQSGAAAFNGFAVLADPPTILVCRPPGRRGTLQLVDLRNYGVEKRSDIGPESTWLHCAEQWVRSVIEWIRREHLGSLQLTAASQAMHSYRRRFLDNPIHVWRDDNANQLEQAAYYGGRCECFKIGVVEGPVYHLDVNSLYPAACRGLHVPVRLIDCLEGPLCEGTEVIKPGRASIASVVIETDEPRYPLRRDGLTVYPVGRFATALAEPELWDAIQRHCVREIMSMALYECQDILTDYMEWMYSERIRARQRGDSATAQLIKRMLVGLPGKFIQQVRSWNPDKTRRASAPWRLWREIDREKREVKSYRAFGWQVQREDVGGLAPQAIPAIGAFITSAARVRMRELEDLLPERSLLYTDTDSLWVTEAGYDALHCHGCVDDSAIGMLKLVEKVDKFDVRGIKNYIADGRAVRAGLSRTATVVGADKSSGPTLRHVHADLARNRAPFPIDQAALRDEYPIYKHGVVGPDGWVVPWRVGNG